jgi:outer membrane immunogenic protein
MAVPYVTWTGCYLGGNVGYHRSSYDSFVSSDDGPGFEWRQAHTFSQDGAIGGYQVGCQVQTGHFVWGIEHDYGWAGGSQSRTYINDPTETPPDTSTFSARTKSLITVRGRFGYAEDNTFIYATAGWAGAKFSFFHTS